MIVGFVLIVVFILWETKYAFPMMPPIIWKDKNFNLVSLDTSGYTYPSSSPPTLTSPGPPRS